MAVLRENQIDPLFSAESGTGLFPALLQLVGDRMSRPEPAQPGVTYLLDSGPRPVFHDQPITSTSIVPDCTKNSMQYPDAFPGIHERESPDTRNNRTAAI